MTEITDLRAWLYHSEHAPRIFETEAELKAAAAEGWVDSPAKALLVAEEPVHPVPPQSRAPALPVEGMDAPKPAPLSPSGPKRKRL